MSNTIAIVGGGAAGLIAAIAAKKINSSARVVILERMDRVGKKILATGNGRCNYTNEHCIEQRFHGCKDFAMNIMSSFSKEQTIAFFEELGIMPRVEGDKYYPMSLQSSAVLDCLRMELYSLGVEEICSSNVEAIKPHNGGYLLSISQNSSFYADKLIIAAGGAASSKLGSNGSGFALMKSLGFISTKLRPALVQLKTETEAIKSLQGIKFEGTAALIGKKLIRKEEGEVLFTSYGLSGPPIIQLSTNVAENVDKPLFIELDFLPSLNKKELLEMLYARISAHPSRSLEEFLIGILNKRIGMAVMKYANLFPLSSPCGELSYEELLRLCDALKIFKLKLLGDMGFENAQVTAGGVCCDQFSSNLEAHCHKGLYACGEILDVNGECGGFNLQWAWSSGMIAGLNAAKI